MPRLIPASLLALLLAAGLAGCATAPGAPTPGPAPAAGAAREAALEALYAQHWERLLARSPEFASYLGDPRYNDRWSDARLEAIEAGIREDRATLAALQAMDLGGLSPAAALNARLFRLMLEQGLEAHRYRGFLLPISHDRGLQTAHEILEWMRLSTLKDHQDWIARLRAFDTRVAQTQALMEQGLAEGQLPPRVLMEKVLAPLARQQVASPEESPFYAPFRDLPASFSAAEQAQLRADARAAIAEVVLPAYARFSQFFRERYLPACPQAVGLSARPQGAAHYDFLIRLHTTTDLDAEAIHQIGLAEVARIRAQMEALKTATGFDGDLAAFFQFLRSDPRFFHPTGEALFNHYLQIAKRIDPELTRLFGTLPRTPYGLRPIPDSSAPYTTTAYYFPPSADGTRAGYFYTNLYRPDSRPIWEMEALTVHEAMPGHHLQIALAQELGAQPAFRKYGLEMTVFVEGWGLYSESLGEDLGLYRDPYSKFGQLTYEMWRAVRLVVDTGLHAKGWSRQQAIDYFRTHAPKAELDIVNEIDRYIGTPGQALAYKIGELRIQALRREAREQLGERFDVRGFHDAVLAQGAIPLDELERAVRAWIDRQRSR